MELWKTASVPPAQRDENLPEGVSVVELRGHPDDRGRFTEVFRREWDLGVDPVQWNVVRSEAGVLRGVHVHPRHDDYLTVLAGRATVGLRDLRPGSPTADRAATVELNGERPAAIVIPHGVAHGFYFHEPSLHAYAVSHYWDPDDELACRWDDPEVGIEWPEPPRLVSERDASAPPLAELRARLAS